MGEALSYPVYILIHYTIFRQFIYFKFQLVTVSFYLNILCFFCIGTVFFSFFVIWHLCCSSGIV